MIHVSVSLLTDGAHSSQKEVANILRALADRIAREGPLQEGEFLAVEDGTTKGEYSTRGE